MGTRDRHGVIALLTDFGTEDSFVGVMKGVISSICPEAAVIDLCHRVPPFDVLEAGFILSSSYRYFPQGTVHVAVIDPGVGGRRRILAARAFGHVFLAPDNGLLGPVLKDREPELMVSVENAAFFLEPVSRTFHGRDIFAPVAAHLARGIDPASLGPPVEDYRKAAVPLPARTRDGEGGVVLQGEVVHVDRFGNCITNIPGTEPIREVRFSGRTVGRIASSYDEVPEGEAVAIVGSSGYLEIASNRGRADRDLELSKGKRVEVHLDTRPGVAIGGGSS